MHEDRVRSKGIPKKIENVRQKDKRVLRKLRIFVKRIYRVRHRNEGIPKKREYS